MTALADLSDAIEQVVRVASPSVVSVDHARGQGSGLVVASDGYVVTNSHVVRGANELGVRLAPGERVNAKLVGDDPASDLAVLRLGSGSAPSLPLLEERRLRVGQLVLAIGNPLRFDRSVSLGVVSAVERTLPAAPGHALEGLVQTDAAINPGSSGGPLLDAHGTVVGITTAVIPRARGIGFAIPAHTVSWVVAMLLKQGHIERPRIGVAARGVELSPGRIAALGQGRAVEVLEVASDSPALRAGLQSGDLILRANGKPVGSVDDLVRTLVLTGGAELGLTLARGSREVELVVRPRPEQRAA
ncbi:MAG TPA: trypsin-like peptidase domain-containing protein [Polyangiaceae bacterium]|nr:trypsin-like peptidase domain-containing protein [Polyangiaceae bacterium]